MAVDKEFQLYFRALERAGGEDRCFLCRRSPAEVKAFFGFHEDGTPIDAARYGIEDVVLDPKLDIMSYRGHRPVCAVCQLNYDTILLAEEGRRVLARVLDEVENESDRLWSKRPPTPEELKELEDEPRSGGLESRGRDAGLFDPEPEDREAR